jgi:type I restriction enzyme S subunit
MSKWPLVALGEIFEISRGGSPRPIQKFITDDADGVNWIMISDATDSSKYISKTKKRILKSGVKNSRMVHPGDFLLTNSMSFGRPYIMRTLGCIHDGWLVLSAKGNGIDHDYFYHLLGSKQIYTEFERRASGATVKNLNIDLVKEVEVPLPSLDKQRRIAAILDQTDELRRNRLRTIEGLDDLTEAIFIEMFVQNEGHNWPIQRVADIATDVRTGPFGSQLLHSEFVDDGIAVLGIDNAVNNEFRWDERRFITEQKYRALRRYTVRPGDVLITLMGTCGRCAVVPDDIPIAINTKHLCCITVDEKIVLPAFLHASFLQHPSVLKQLGVQAKGAVMPGLNMGIIKSLELRIPPLGLQRTFVSRIEALNEVRANCRAHRDHLDRLFGSLEHRAFRDELRISGSLADDDAALAAAG